MTDSRDNIKKYAFKLLNYKGRSEKELTERLIKKGFNKTEVFSTITYLKNIGLIDDKLLAEDLKRQAQITKMLSRNGAMRFMLSRGIPREIVNSVLDNEKEDDIEIARRLVDKKIKCLRNYSLMDVKKKIYGLLLRKGYSFDVINIILKEKSSVDLET
ncbi:MAG: regulatory protein RecX [Nitrospirota bacterium]